MLRVLLMLQVCSLLFLNLMQVAILLEHSEGAEQRLQLLRLQLGPSDQFDQVLEINYVEHSSRLA